MYVGLRNVLSPATSKVLGGIINTFIPKTSNIDTDPNEAHVVFWISVAVSSWI